MNLIYFLLFGLLLCTHQRITLQQQQPQYDYDYDEPETVNSGPPRSIYSTSPELFAYATRPIKPPNKPPSTATKPGFPTAQETVPVQQPLAQSVAQYTQEQQQPRYSIQPRRLVQFAEPQPQQQQQQPVVVQYQDQQQEIRTVPVHYSTARQQNIQQQGPILQPQYHPQSQPQAQVQLQPQHIEPQQLQLQQVHPQHIQPQQQELEPIQIAPQQLAAEYRPQPLQAQDVQEPQQQFPIESPHQPQLQPYQVRPQSPQLQPYQVRPQPRPQQPSSSARFVTHGGPLRNIIRRIQSRYEPQQVTPRPIHEEPEPEEEAEDPQQESHGSKYQFEYAVRDPLTGDAKSQRESREGDAVVGSYSVVDADGTKRTVEYRADAKSGFNAVIRTEAGESGKRQEFVDEEEPRATVTRYDSRITNGRPRGLSRARTSGAVNYRRNQQQQLEERPQYVNYVDPQQQYEQQQYFQ